MKLALVLCAAAVASCSSKGSDGAGESKGRRPRSTEEATDPPARGSGAPEKKWRDKPWDGEKACDLEGVGYVTQAKISEAKNTLGAIMRSARSSDERETMSQEIVSADPQGFTHALCGSSTTVPLEVPHGAKYQPTEADFRTGDRDTGGWKCLRFEMNNPFYFQYHYAKGSGYVGPGRGLPNPGPDGFEASAVGDLDGDGRTSTFTMVGVVDPKLQTVTISTEVYCDDPDE